MNVLYNLILYFWKIRGYVKKTFEKKKKKKKKIIDTTIIEVYDYGFGGDVKIHQPRPLITTASQCLYAVRGPDPLILPWPFRAHELLRFGMTNQS